MKNYIEINTNKGAARLYKGKSLANCPSTYRKFAVINHNIGNNYNSSIITLYTNRQGKLKYEIYRDGNFFPYYGTFEFLPV